MGVWAVVVNSQLLLLCLLDSAGDVEEEVGLADVAVRGAIYTVTSTANNLPERGNLMTTSIIRLSPFILVLRQTPRVSL